MTIFDIIDMEIKHYSLFSKQKKRLSGMILYDDQQKDKYGHNFMMLNEKRIELSELKHYEKVQCKNGFVKFRLEHQASLDYKFLESYQVSKLAYFYARVKDLNVRSLKDAHIHIIDPFGDDQFFDFMYQEDLPYGTSYAIGNIKRQRDTLKAQLNDYFYLGLVYEGTYIGHLNAHIQGIRAKIDEFYVIDAYQKQGYGTALMSFMLNHLSLKGVEEVYLVTDLADTAQALYVKYGFKMVGTFKEYQKFFEVAK